MGGVFLLRWPVYGWRMQEVAVLQERLPFAPWMEGRTWRLPGIVPLVGDWLLRDEAFAGQMAERDRLIAGHGQAVHALLPEGRAAADELYGLVLDKLRADRGYAVDAGSVLRPDGVRVGLDPDMPLLTLGRLVQQDLCLMQAGASSEHVLTGAILCFPASWTLAQKIGRPLTAIHVPVATYDADMARRVQRLFDAVRVESPLMRFNALVYDDPVLHQPRREGVERPRPVQRLYLRSERQCLLRLPQSGAVLFSIHTYLVRMEALEPALRDGLAAAGL